MSTGIPTKLIVLVAFVRDDYGELQPAFEPREMPNEAAAKQQARIMESSGKFVGGIAWWRAADLVNGEFGEPVVIHQWGELPEMD